MLPCLVVSHHGNMLFHIRLQCYLPQMIGTGDTSLYDANNCEQRPVPHFLPYCLETLPIYVLNRALYYFSSLSSSAPR